MNETSHEREGEERRGKRERNRARAAGGGWVERDRGTERKMLGRNDRNTDGTILTFSVHMSFNNR